MTGSGEASWADFADAIFDHQARRGFKRPTVERITTAHFPTPAARPANSCLDCSKFAAQFGYRAPLWRDSLPMVLDRLAST